MKSDSTIHDFGCVGNPASVGRKSAFGKFSRRDSSRFSSHHRNLSWGDGNGHGAYQDRLGGLGHSKSPPMLEGELALEMPGELFFLGVKSLT